MSFGEEVEKKVLDKICDMKNGYTPSKSNKEYWKNGDISWFRMDDIRENGRILEEAIQKTNKKGVKGNLFEANSIIISTSATIGEHALIKIPFIANQRFTVLTLKQEYQKIINIKYLFYYCFILDEWCKNNTTKSSFESVDMVRFKKIKIPLPSLEEQQRIVDILDRFDKLVNDIKEGLPAEIEMRQKQYEYYRDKLLNFKRLNMEGENGKYK